MDRSTLSLRKFADAFELAEQIGEGSYGVVFKCYARTLSSSDGAAVDSAAAGGSRQAYAVKCVHTRSEAGTKSLVTSMASLREVKLLKELRHHPNIVKLEDVYLSWEEQTMHLVFEYADTDLNRLIKDKSLVYTEEQTRQWMFQLLDGTRYLHENWVLHRDLKPQNILVCSTERGSEVMKIADFGLARIFQQPVKALSDIEKVVVTLWYRAPELLLGSKHYTKAVDIWALGCIMGELMTRQQLFMGAEAKDASGAPFQEEQCRVIFSMLGVPQVGEWEGLESLPEYGKIRGWRSGFPSKSMLREYVTTNLKIGGSSRAKVSPDALDLLEKLLALDPTRRITATEALKHPYFRGLAPATLPLCGPSPPSPKLGPRSSSGAAGLPPPIPHSGAPLLVPSSVPVPFPSAASTEDDTADAQDGAEGDGGDNATGKPLKRKK